MPFDTPVMTMNLTMAAAQVLPSLPAGRHVLGDGAKKLPRQPASDQWAEHRHDRVLQSESPLPFDLVQSFKMSFANHLADGCNVPVFPRR